MRTVLTGAPNVLTSCCWVMNVPVVLTVFPSFISVYFLRLAILYADSLPVNAIAAENSTQSFFCLQLITWQHRWGTIKTVIHL